MVFYTINTTPTTHINIHTAPGGGTNKAVPSPINLTFSSVPEPASKLSYLGERGEPRENARTSAKPRRAEERSFPHPPAFASPLACLSRVYVSRYFPNGELARRLAGYLFLFTEPGNLKMRKS